MKPDVVRRHRHGSAVAGHLITDTGAISDISISTAIYHWQRIDEFLMRPAIRLDLGGNSLLFEYRPAGHAEIGFLPPQAGGDRPDIRDLAGAETINVGGAGFFLFRRCEFSARGPDGGKRDQKAKYQSWVGAAGDNRTAKSVRHVAIPSGLTGAADRTGVISPDRPVIVG
jgi:hypothetical protein